MRITEMDLRQMIREAIQEHRGMALRDGNVKQQGQAITNDRENAENTKYNRERAELVAPGLKDFLSMSRGVISEGDIEDTDNEEWIKIKRPALNALLTENNEALVQSCNKIGMKSLKQWLTVSNAFADASKGKFGDKK